MPITPLHFGPAIAARAAFGPRFGLLGFLTSQLLLDQEPGLKLFGIIHEGTGLHEGHTWLLAPAFVVAAWVLAVVGQRLVQGKSRLMFAEVRLRWLRSSTWSEGIGAVIGVISHLLLDALYHSDVAIALGLPGINAFFPPATVDLALLAFLPISAAWLWLSARKLDKYTVNR